VKDNQDLDRLCAYYGIAASYKDNQGREQRVPDGTRRALLQGMGGTAGDAETERRSLMEALDGSGAESCRRWLSLRRISRPWSSP
jgi:hypothetical protein